MEIDTFKDFQVKIDKIYDLFQLFKLCSYDHREVNLQQEAYKGVLESIVELEDMAGKIEKAVTDKFLSKGKNQCIRLKQLYLNSLNKLRDYIFTSTREFTLLFHPIILGAYHANLITTDKEKLIQRDKFLLAINDIDIKFYAVTVEFHFKMNRIHPVSAGKTSPNIDNITFEDLFKRSSDHDNIVKILSDNGYIDPITKVWIDKKNASIKTLIAILKDLKNKHYFKKFPNVTGKIMIAVGENTFRKEFKIDSVRKANPDNTQIPVFPQSTPVR